MSNGKENINLTPCSFDKQQNHAWNQSHFQFLNMKPHSWKMLCKEWNYIRVSAYHEMLENTQWKLRKPWNLKPNYFALSPPEIFNTTFPLWNCDKWKINLTPHRNIKLPVANYIHETVKDEPSTAIT